MVGAVLGDGPTDAAAKLDIADCYNGDGRLGIRARAGRQHTERDRGCEPNC
jgi:hypothetical protein